MRLYGGGEGSWRPHDDELDVFEQVLAQQSIREPDLQVRAAKIADKLVERGFVFAVVLVDCDTCAANSSLPGARWAAYEHEGHTFIFFVVK
jgi:hypothetical protein